ncbi:MAG: hypothetical protein JXR42_00785 [Gammaproteobacteria bacterium]|nr:hypothetical protein [Gammaproteobacteria bacterium]
MQSHDKILSFGLYGQIDIRHFLYLVESAFALESSQSKDEYSLSIIRIWILARWSNGGSGQGMRIGVCDKFSYIEFCLRGYLRAVFDDK